MDPKAKNPKAKGPKSKGPKAGTDAAPRRPGARTFARLAAVQALYQIEQNGNRPDQVIAEFERHRLAAPAGTAAGGEVLPGDPPPSEAKDPAESVEDMPALEADRTWFRDLVSGTSARQAEIDGHINRATDGRREVARMELTLRAILRAGVYELLARVDTPTAVVIAEYVALAYDFFSKTEADLVHAILDRIGREVRHGA